MHASLSNLKYGIPFFLNLIVDWLIRFCHFLFWVISHSASSPLKLTHVCLFQNICNFTQISLYIQNIMTHLLARNSMSHWPIWENHSLIPCLTTKNIWCYLLKGLICLHKQKCPFVSLYEMFLSSFSVTWRDQIPF